MARSELAITLGKRIYLLRTQLHLSQRAFAEAVGCAAYLVSLWENGKTLISTRHLFSICRVFFLPLASFDENDIEPLSQVVFVLQNGEDR